MNLRERIERYTAIEAKRCRPLIVYATSTRAGVHAMMAGDAVREFIDQIEAIQDRKSVDVLIHSTGGDALTAWKLMSVLREQFEHVAVLVPYMAFSAATVFSMGADEIIMHPHASLGPIDPQITMQLPDGSRRQFAFEDVGAFLRFLNTEVGLTEQAHVSSVIDRLFAAVDPVNIGAAKRASELATDIGERLLQMHMKGDEDRARARTIAESLNKKFFAHGDAVSRSRARDLGLKIGESDADLEKLIWDAYVGLEAYMDLRMPFNALHHFLANGGAGALAPTAPLVMPPNTPAQLLQQLWTQAANNSLQAMAQPGIQVDYTIVNAVIESPRLATEHRTDGALSATRVAGGDVQMSAVEKTARWQRVAIQ
jgi:hypothetical protein